MMADHCHSADFLNASSHAIVLDPFSAYPFEPHDLESDSAHERQQSCPRPPSDKLRGSLSAARHLYLWYTKLAPQPTIDADLLFTAQGTIPFRDEARPEVYAREHSHLPLQSGLLHDSVSPV
jgi:hypothetical protein